MREVLLAIVAKLDATEIVFLTFFALMFMILVGTFVIAIIGM